MITFRFEEFTPERAKMVLSQHDEAVEEGKIKNRKRSKAAVERYSRDMVEGLWNPNTAETIKFSCEQNGDNPGGQFLVDGQQRLEAVALANQVIGIHVAYGVDPNVFPNLDSGIRRTLLNTLQMARETDANVVATALTWLSRWDPLNDSLKAKNTGLSSSIGLKMLNADPAVRESAERVKEITLMAKGSAAFLHRMMRDKNAELADHFVQAIALGENLNADDPFYILRERLIANSKRRPSIKQIDIINLTIKAWNAAREGLAIKKLQYSRKPEGMVVMK